MRVPRHRRAQDPAHRRVPAERRGGRAEARREHRPPAHRPRHTIADLDCIHDASLNGAGELRLGFERVTDPHKTVGARRPADHHRRGGPGRGRNRWHRPTGRRATGRRPGHRGRRRQPGPTLRPGGGLRSPRLHRRFGQRAGRADRRTGHPGGPARARRHQPRHLWLDGHRGHGERGGAVHRGRPAQAAGGGLEPAQPLLPRRADLQGTELPLGGAGGMVRPVRRRRHAGRGREAAQRASEPGPGRSHRAQRAGTSVCRGGHARRPRPVQVLRREGSDALEQGGGRLGREGRTGRTGRIGVGLRPASRRPLRRRRTMRGWSAPRCAG